MPPTVTHRSPAPKAPPWPAGFTLAEVLVVTGIVTALVAILLPAVSAMWGSARQTACAANLRQWGAAATTYALASGGSLPRRGQGKQPTTRIDRPEDWFNALPPRLNLRPFSQLVAAGVAPRVGDGSVWMCPEATETAGGSLFTYGRRPGRC